MAVPSGAPGGWLPPGSIHWYKGYLLTRGSTEVSMRASIAFVGAVLFAAMAFLQLAAADTDTPKDWRAAYTQLKSQIEDLETRLLANESTRGWGLKRWSTEDQSKIDKAFQPGRVLSGVATQNDVPEAQLKCSLRVTERRTDGTVSGTIEWASGSGFQGGVLKFRGSITSTHISLYEHSAVRQGDLVVGTRYLLQSVQDGSAVGTWTYVGADGLLHGSLALRLP